MSGKATLRELQSWYDLTDLADFHEALDLELEMMPEAPKARR